MGRPVYLHVGQVILSDVLFDSGGRGKPPPHFRHKESVTFVPLSSLIN